jgi:hypothetical protein
MEDRDFKVREGHYRLTAVHRPLNEEKYRLLRMDRRTYYSPEFKRQVRLKVNQQSRRAVLRTVPPVPIQKVVGGQSVSAQAR